MLHRRRELWPALNQTSFITLIFFRSQHAAALSSISTPFPHPPSEDCESQHSDLNPLPQFDRQQYKAFQETMSYIDRLKKCSKIKDLSYGKKIHAQICRSGLGSNIYIASSLVSMYAKCGSLSDALRVFDKIIEPDAVCWNAIIAAYAKLGQPKRALELCKKMKLKGFEPTSVTLVFMLHSCASLGFRELGKQVHAKVVEAGLEEDVYVGGALVNMYVKLGFVDDAWRVFDRLPEKTLVTWTSMISGYAYCGNVEAAFGLYNQIKESNLTPNSVTFVCILKACSSIATIHLGKQVHAEVIEAGLESNMFVGPALIDMYAKCGSMINAREVFERSLQENVVAWNAIISGYARHGDGAEAFHLFHRMKHHNVKPNEVTFLSILCLCSRLGLVNESRYIFNMMIKDFKFLPTFKHYGCLVNLLGKAGQLDEAVILIEESPLTSELSLWISLLGSCRLHRNLKLAEYVARRVLELDPQNSAACVLLSNLYAEGGSWSKRAELRVLMKERGVRKEPGCSSMA